jgi:hypothetical protein
MKAEFYFDHRRYICSLVRVDSVKELKIKNCQGLVLAVKQGQKVGLIGKTRQDARQVDVSQPYFYNLIKAAMSALDLASKDEVILDKNRAIADAEKIIQQQTREISVLNEQMNMLIAQLKLLSAQHNSAQQQQLPTLLIENDIADSEISQEVDRPLILPADLPLQLIENEIRESELSQETERPLILPADLPLQLIENEIRESELSQETERHSAPLADLPMPETDDRISDSEIERSGEFSTAETPETALDEIVEQVRLEEIEGEEELGVITGKNVNPENAEESEIYAIEVAVRGNDREVKRLPRRASNRKMRKKS